MIGRRMRVAACATGVLVLALAGGSVSQETNQFDVIIAKDSYAFDPPKIAIEVGDTIHWRNQDSRRHHTASIPGFGPDDSLEILCDELYAGRTCSHTFTRPGRYPYFCFIHSRMQGLVVVVER